MIHSFLLIGQSNMAGRGFIEEAVPVDNTHIKILRNGRWQKMFRPVNPDRRFSGVNLAESFAEAYANKHGVEAGLIPCADGGTSIAQWAPGTLLFDNAVNQAKLAMRTSNIVGILWHQGESDIDNYPAYKGKLLAFMAALRKALDLYDVPFIVGGLGDYLVNYEEDDCSNYVCINKALQEIAEEDPLVGFVSAEGLTPNPDNLHIDARSLHTFGLRYFEEFEKLADPNKVFEDKPHDDLARTAIDEL